MEENKIVEEDGLQLMNGNTIRQLMSEGRYKYLELMQTSDLHD